MSSAAIEKQSKYLDKKVGETDKAFVEVLTRAPENVLDNVLSSIADADDHGYLPMHPDVYPVDDSGNVDEGASPKSVAAALAQDKLSLDDKRKALGNFYRMVKEKEVVVKTFTHPTVWPIVLGVGAGALLFKKRVLGSIIGGAAAYAISRTLSASFVVPEEEQ